MGKSGSRMFRVLTHYKQTGRGLKCAYCERPLLRRQPLTVDHWIPLSKGGNSEISNMVLACSKCNRVKGDKIPTPKLLKHLRQNYKPKGKTS